MRATAAVLALVVLLPCSAALAEGFAGLNRGDSVIVRLTDGHELVGRVEEGDDAHLTLAVGSRDVSLAPADIAEWHRFASAPTAPAPPRPPLPYSPELARRGDHALALSVGATAAGWLSLRLWESRAGAPVRGLAGAAAVIGIFVGPGVGLAFAGEPARATIGIVVRGVTAVTALLGFAIAASPCVTTSSGASGVASNADSCGNVDGLYVGIGAAALFAASTGFDFYEAHRAPRREAAKHAARVGVAPWVGRDRGGVLFALRF